MVVVRWGVLESDSGEGALLVSVSVRRRKEGLGLALAWWGCRWPGWIDGPAWLPPLLFFSFYFSFLFFCRKEKKRIRENFRV